MTVHQHEGGFFSNFNKVITFLKNNNVSKIDWKLYGQPYGAFAYSCGEVFGKLFESYDDGQPSHDQFILRNYIDYTFTGKDVYKKYNDKDQSWRKELNSKLKYFKPTDLLQKNVAIYNNAFDKIRNKELIAVLKRNELLKCEQQTNKLPTLNDYFNQIDQYYDDNTYIWLSVDNKYDLDQFLKRYSRCIYNPRIRRSDKNTDTEPHFTPGTELDAVFTFMEVYSMAKCNKLIHPISNMATAALYFNPEMESIYI